MIIINIKNKDKIKLQYFDKLKMNYKDINK